MTAIAVQQIAPQPVEHLVKMSDGRWVLTDYEDSSAIIALDSVGTQIALKDMYEQVWQELDSDETKNRERGEE